MFENVGAFYLLSLSEATFKSGRDSAITASFKGIVRCGEATNMYSPISNPSFHLLFDIRSVTGFVIDVIREVVGVSIFDGGFSIC